MRFDDPSLVAKAGLVLVSTLVMRLELERLINAMVRLVGRVGGAQPGRKVLTLVHAMAAGASHIDHVDVLRAGNTAAVLPHRMMAPSTLGTFLRAFTSAMSASSGGGNHSVSQLLELELGVLDEHGMRVGSAPSVCDLRRVGDRDWGGVEGPVVAALPKPGLSDRLRAPTAGLVVPQVRAIRTPKPTTRGDASDARVLCVPCGSSLLGEAERRHGPGRSRRGRVLRTSDEVRQIRVAPPPAKAEATRVTGSLDGAAARGLAFCGLRIGETSPFLSQGSGCDDREIGIHGSQQADEPPEVGGFAVDVDVAVADCIAQVDGAGDEAYQHRTGEGQGGAA